MRAPLYCMTHASSSVESNTDHPVAVSARGVEHAHVIDIVAHDAQRDEAVLIMLEPRPWEESEQRLFQLQEKINAYLAFALDGEMAECHPELMTKRLRLQVDCVDMPPSAVVEFLSVVREQIAFQNIDLEVRVMGNGGCGSGCACE
ncbi:MAG TPA: DUF6572 domain-containing protein [Chthoniobacteraceae bacterium]|jgi:hypothetical protein|nr:DUF6572 domain-containing protein [Chthoniobacteraceae bacterium]